MSDPNTPETEDAPVEKKKKFFTRMKEGLSRSTRAMSDGVTGIFTKRKLDGETLQDLEDLLVTSDLGLDAAVEITEAVAKDRYDKEVSPEEVRKILSSEITKTLLSVEKPFAIQSDKKPNIVLVIGVNGAGKTTTIGKLAAKTRAEGKSVMLAAGDTFRAAAIEQLGVWGERVGAPVVKTKVGGDAAGLAYEAVERAKSENTDLLLIDTAGRLQNKSDLMAELEKVIRVIRKQDETAPHQTLLVLDATTGQNALNQVDVFTKVAGVTGLVMTKLDGTARGGILVAIARKYGLPVHMIGVGEGVDDLQDFSAENFAKAITGA
jgi:fused signal recognition particle receptor